MKLREIHVSIFAKNESIHSGRLDEQAIEHWNSIFRQENVGQLKSFDRLIVMIELRGKSNDHWLSFQNRNREKKKKKNVDDLFAFVV